MKLVDLLPDVLTNLKSLMQAKIRPVPQPPQPLVREGLLDDAGCLTPKGNAFINRIYSVADVLDVVVA